jgi:succinate dehydrogenase flavin-adding protein (antitoxin of CptAB toxin-antitoxin module)
MRKKRKLLTQALAAIEFIMDDQENSELRQVLEEDKEDFDAWIANMKDLKANLSKIVLQVQD